MRKIETALLGSALAVALSAPAMAEDFHALAGLQGATPAPLQDEALATTEGGQSCTGPVSAEGPVAYCAVSTDGVQISAVGVGVGAGPITATILTVAALGF